MMLVRNSLAVLFKKDQLINDVGRKFFRIFLKRPVFKSWSLNSMILVEYSFDFFLKKEY